MKHTFRLIFAVLAGISLAACTSELDGLLNAAAYAEIAK